MFDYLNMIRIILHIDIDTFYLSVAFNENKNLKNDNKPTVIAENEKWGMILTSNKYARKLNIKAGVPLFKAKEICSNILVIEPQYELYKKYSEKFFKILTTYCRKIEIFSIDECFLDISTHWKKYKTVTNLIKNIKNTIKRELNLNCSIGVSYTKFLAKTATNICKPNNFLIITVNNRNKIISDLKIQNIVGIGPSTYNVLKNLNIKTVNDFVDYEKPNILKKYLGKRYISLLTSLLGLGSDPIVSKNSYEYKTFSISETFHYKIISEKQGYQEIIKLFLILYERIILYNKLIKTISIKIKYEKTTNKWTNKQITLKKYTNNFNELLQELKKLFLKNFTNRIIVGLGIEFTNLWNLLMKDYFKNDYFFYGNINKKILFLIRKLNLDNPDIDLKTLKMYNYKKSQHKKFLDKHHIIK